MPSGTKRHSATWDSDAEDFSSEDESCRRRPKRRAKMRKRKEASTPWSEEGDGRPPRRGNSEGHAWSSSIVNQSMRAESHAEMELLIRLVQQRQDPHTGSDALVNWADVSALMGNRNPKQCREKYRNDLRPDISKGPWSPEEDYVLALAHSQLGNKWSDIAQFLPRRAENTIKNHWYATFRSKVDHTKTFLWVYATYATSDPTSNCLQAAHEEWAVMVESSNGAVPSLSTFQVQTDHFTDGPGAQHNALLQQAELQAALQGQGTIPLRSATARAAVLSSGGGMSRARRPTPAQTSLNGASAQQLPPGRQQNDHEGALRFPPGGQACPATDDGMTIPHSSNHAVAVASDTTPNALLKRSQPSCCGAQFSMAAQHTAGRSGTTNLPSLPTMPLRSSEGGDASCTVAFHLSSVQPMEHKHTKPVSRGDSSGAAHNMDRAGVPPDPSALGLQPHVPPLPVQPAANRPGPYLARRADLTAAVLPMVDVTLHGCTGPSGELGKHWQGKSAGSGTVAAAGTDGCSVNTSASLPSPEVLVFGQPTNDDQWLTRGTALATATASPTACSTEQAPAWCFGMPDSKQGSMSASLTSSSPAHLRMHRGGTADTHPFSRCSSVGKPLLPEQGQQHLPFSMSCAAASGLKARAGATDKTASSTRAPLSTAVPASPKGRDTSSTHQAPQMHTSTWQQDHMTCNGAPNPSLAEHSNLGHEAQHLAATAASSAAPLLQDQWPDGNSCREQQGLACTAVRQQQEQRSGHPSEQSPMWPNNWGHGTKVPHQSRYPSMYGGNTSPMHHHVSAHGRRRHHAGLATSSHHYHAGHSYMMPPAMPHVHGQAQQSLPSYGNHTVYQRPVRPSPRPPFLMGPLPYQQPYYIAAAHLNQHAPSAAAAEARHVARSPYMVHEVPSQTM